MRKPAASLSVFAAAAVLVSGCVGHAPDLDAVDLGSRSAPDGGTTLRLAHVYDTEHPTHTCGAEELRERFAEVGVNLEIFPAGQLGDEEEALQLLHTGNLEMTIAGPAFLGSWYDQAEVFDAAYAFRNVDHFDGVTNGEIGEEVWEGLRRDAGLRVLASWYYGTRHTTANHPVRGPDDLKGSKIRVPSAPVYLSNTKVMGGTATPMALGEVYLSLQQGAIDAQENPVPTIHTSRFDEVQTHVSLTGHIVQGVMPVIADPVFQDLSPEQRSHVADATLEVSEDVRACIEQEETEVLEEWRETGGPEVVDDVDAEEFAEQARDMLPREHEEWGDLYLRIQDEGEDYE
ncbi:DctP family TRAP transporter solute-binding subunit [Allosalinactinospora lopnorensis]|uniref:DctP family TRAP transporter solute-binding subunit n=1 Tax=Allosalinactinospora lopnorensis TaxID=1352348 RepID=UPI000623DAAD|nr:DctP family TRAP transporter solute-binding subunit [Allosalinactinospora lopnorensis]